MKRRATNIVRVLDRCARCGGRPDLYSVKRVVLFLPNRHELIVCTGYCATLPPGEPTSMERDAMSIDAGNPIDAMAFADRWRASVSRVQRTAEHFLGGDVYAGLVPQLRARREEERAKRDAWRDDYVATLEDPGPIGSRTPDAADDDDLPF